MSVSNGYGTDERMSGSGRSNIDDVRARIMALEGAQIFDGREWARALADLADRPAALADAQRRMETAIYNARAIVATLDAVAVETEGAYV